MRRCLRLLLGVFGAWSGLGLFAGAGEVSWPEPTLSARPWTRWWWPGSAVDPANLTKQLEQLRRAGLGGVEITPIYGARGYEARYLDFLSPRWMEMLRHTTDEAKRLGLGVDMATGTGWPFGGPWVAPADGAHRLVFAGGTLAGAPTSMKVKRAGPGGEGLVVDPYSPAAVRRYLAPFDSAFRRDALKKGAVRAQFHDSFEYHDAGWTPELEHVFEGMHGYALAKHGATLMEDNPIDQDLAARLKGDYRATLAQLHLDYLKTWIDWSHGHGGIVRNQSHGAPANLLDLYGAVDIPETETFGFTPFPIPRLRRNWTSKRDIPESLVLRMAASAAHVTGRPLVSSETCTWLREHWHDALAFAKPEIDRLFVEGINHIFYHGTVYSPQDAPWPGWLFYASTQFNPSNPWWDDFAALNRYVTRVQSILQSGKPDNPVLIYWPFHDVLHNPKGLMLQFGVHDPTWLTNSRFGALARKLYAEGWHYDGISDAQLQAARVENGWLVTPGARYRALVIPRTNHMPVETLEHLLELKRAGAKIVFEALPTDVPGLGTLDERRSKLKRLNASTELNESASEDVTARLRTLGVPRESAADSKLSFVRRSETGGNSYFFANLGAEAFDGWVTLGIPAKNATLLDPLTGAAGAAPSRVDATGALQVQLTLLPGESTMLRTTEASGSAGSSFAFLKPVGAGYPLDGQWRIDFFKGGPVLPEPLETEQLKSWTDLGDDIELQRFAGTARYRIEFDAPADTADDWMLDLGDVRESARVQLNGEALGTAWSIPFRLRLNGALRPGRNTLEIEVTNTAANRIRDMDRRKVDWKIMHEINFVDLDYRPFNAAAWPITPAGLLGPVRLLPLRRL